MDNVYNMSDYHQNENNALLEALTEGLLEEKTMDVLLTMFENGLVDISMDDEGEMFFEINPEATEDQWETAREEFLKVEGAAI